MSLLILGGWRHQDLAGVLEGTVIRLREQLLNDGFNSSDIEQMMQENFDEEDYPL